MRTICPPGKIKTLSEFAKTISRIQQADWWLLMGCSGKQGVGKSCFTSQITKLVAQKNNTPYSYEKNMTYLRDDLKKWIDGKGEKKTGQIQEYSSVLADELISMFFKRNFHDSEQNDSIELLNKCRDRHLFVAGNAPILWSLDKQILGLLTHWVHIPERGKAWIFVPDDNPFVQDPWSISYNKKMFDKHGHPYKCRGFLCEIHFDDWSEEDKEEYYAARNKRRVNTEGQRAHKDKYSVIKAQRDEAIYVLKKKFNLTLKELNEYLTNSGYEMIRKCIDRYEEVNCLV